MCCNLGGDEMTVLKLHQQLLENRIGAFVGYKDDNGSKFPVYADLESAIALIGPPRSGKSTKILAQSIATFPGLVIATTCRGVNSAHDDIIELTRKPRTQIAQATGGQVVELGVDSSMKPIVRRVGWDIISGCSDWEVAQNRANSIAFATIDSDKGLENQDVYINYVSYLLSGLFYYFALSKKPVSYLKDAILSQSHKQLKDLLGEIKTAFLAQSNISSYKEAGQKLNIVLGMQDKSLQSILTQLRTSVENLTMDSSDNVTLDSLLQGHSTVYIQASATPSQSRKTAPIIATFIEELVNLYRSRTRGKRPNAILLALDEVVNVAPIRNLPELLRTGGGDGIQTVIALQDINSAKKRWPNDNLVANCKQVLFSGVTDYDYLHHISEFSGQHLVEEYSYEFPDDLRGIPRELLEAYLSDKVKLSNSSYMTLSLKELDFDYRAKALGYGVRWEDFLEVSSKIQRHRHPRHLPRYTVEQLSSFGKDEVLVIDGGRIETLKVPFYKDVPFWRDEIFQVD